MTENIKKVYSKKSVILATLLGGPIAGAYLFFRNFRALQEENKAKISLVIGIIFTLSLIYVDFILSIPIVQNIPAFIILAANAGLASFLFLRFQEDKVSELVESGGEYFSSWNAAGTSLLCLIVTLALIAPLFLGDIWGDEKVKYFGVTENIIVYDEEIPEKDIDIIGFTLQKMYFFHNQDQKKVIVRFDKKDHYKINFEVSDLYWEEKDLLDSFMHLGANVKRELRNKYIKVCFFSESEENFKIVKEYWHLN